jgi:hypothetical protein
MGTRAVVVIAGNNDTRGKGVVRLYRHWDGDPDDVLESIADATAMTNEYIAEHADMLVAWHSPDYENRVVPTVADIPVQGFGERLICSRLRWGCSPYRVDTSFENNSPAVFNGDLKNEHFGEQSDLEWMYLVDLKARTITVWGGDCGDPAEHKAKGPVDPRKHATQLRTDEPKVNYQGADFLAVDAGMTKLRRQGWTITPPRSKAKTWVKKQLVNVVDHIELSLKDEWKTSDVVAFINGIKQDKKYETIPLLADAIQDAGCNNDRLLEQMRHFTCA